MFGWSAQTIWSVAVMTGAFAIASPWHSPVLHLRSLWSCTLHVHTHFSSNVICTGLYTCSLGERGDRRLPSSRRSHQCGALQGLPAKCAGVLGGRDGRCRPAWAGAFPRDDKLRLAGLRQICGACTNRAAHGHIVPATPSQYWSRLAAFGSEE